jgi:multiple sugar transport system permease protein
MATSERSLARTTKIFVYLGLGLATIAVALPVLWMLSVSFRPNGEVMQIPLTWLPKIFTTASYSKVLGEPRYLRCFWNSYFISIVVTLLALFFGTLAGYGIARFRFRGKHWLITFLLITQTFPLVLLTIPYFKVMVAIGLYDTLIALILVYLSFCLPF